MSASKKENLLTAIRGEVPEVVPVAPNLHWRFTHKLFGRHHWKDTIAAHRFIGSTWFRGPISIGPHSDYDLRWNMELRVIEENGTEKKYERIIRTSKGTLTGKHTIGFDPNDPTLGFEYEYFVKNLEDWRIVIAYWEDELAEAGLPSHADIDAASKIMGDDGVASVIINSAYARGSLMRGMEGFLVDLIDAPDLMREVLDLAFELRKQEIHSFLESKAEVMVYDICWATGSHMSPAMFRKWLLREMEEAADMVRKGGKHFGFYTLGRIREHLPAIVGCRPHFVETFEQNEGDITLAEAKERYGKQICLMGNFDPLVLQDGTLEDARREARRCLDEGMKDGGYVMVTGDEVPPTAKVDNLKAMVEIAEEHGRY